MRFNEVREMLAAHLLLTFRQHDHVNRQRAASGEMGFKRLDVQVELPLVVHGASGVHAPITYLRLERRRSPQLERLRWLHVVMPIDEHRRRVSAGVAPFAKYHRVACRGHHLRLETDGPHCICQPRGGTCGIRIVLAACTDTRDTEKIEQLLLETRAMLGEVGLELGR